MKLTVTEASYHHMPHESANPDLVGLTVRETLRELRDVGRSHFGDLGGMMAYLSDGSWIEVQLLAAYERGCQLLSSQRIVRVRWDRGLMTIRIYNW